MKAKLNRIFTLSGRNIKEMLRDPIGLIFNFALPEVMLILFYFAFHSLTAQFEMKYLCPSIVVFAQAFLTLFVGLLVSVDRDGAYVTRLYIAGGKADEFILGYAFSVLPIAILQSVIILLTGVIIEPSFASVYILTGLLLSIFTSILFIGFGLLCGSLCNAKSIGGVCSIVIAGQSVLSGMWFPLSDLPSGFIFFLKCLPFKNASSLTVGATDGLRFEGGFLVPFLIVLAYETAVCILAVLAFSKRIKNK